MSEQSAGAPTRLIAAPWATLADLPDDAPKAHDPDYDALLWQASETLYLLTARQWPGTTTALRWLSSVRGRRCWTPAEQLATAAWPTVPTGWYARDTGTGWRTLQLPDPPVVELLSVRAGGEPVEVDAVLPAGLLTRADGQPWPADGVEVSYRHGLNPPAGGRTSAILLTVELGKAWAREKSCRLPQRAVTVAREGVTVTMIDKLEMLAQGRVGIFEIDSWITSVNPARLQRRSRVWSPDTAGRRRARP